jgi:hypothetical protein
LCSGRLLRRALWRSDRELAAALYELQLGSESMGGAELPALAGGAAAVAVEHEGPCSSVGTPMELKAEVQELRQATECCVRQPPEPTARLRPQAREMAPEPGQEWNPMDGGRCAGERREIL